MGILGAPACRCAVLEFDADRTEAAAGQVRAVGAGKGDLVAVAHVGGTVLQLQTAGGGIVFEDEVQHPGDRIGAVLGGCAIAQHFHPLQGDPGKWRDVDGLGPLVDARHELTDDAAPVSAFAVDEDQRAVGGHAPQIGGTDQRRRIADRLAADVERRRQGGQHVQRVPVAVGLEILGEQHVHGDGQGAGGVFGTPGSHHDQLFDAGFVRRDGRLFGVAWNQGEGSKNQGATPCHWCLRCSPLRAS